MLVMSDLLLYFLYAASYLPLAAGGWLDDFQKSLAAQEDGFVQEFWGGFHLQFISKQTELGHELRIYSVYLQISSVAADSTG